jgi:hypothetical protein
MFNPDLAKFLDESGWMCVLTSSLWICQWNFYIKQILNILIIQTWFHLSIADTICTVQTALSLQKCSC